MKSIKEVKKILTASVSDVIDRVQDVENFMLYINSMTHIAMNKDIIQLLIDIKEVCTTIRE